MRGIIQQAIRAMRALAAPRPASLFCAKRGRSSVVEHQLPKLSVVGSIPIARSSLAASQLRLAGQLKSSKVAYGSRFRAIVAAKVARIAGETVGTVGRGRS